MPPAHQRRAANRSQMPMAGIRICISTWARHGPDPQHAARLPGPGDASVLLLRSDRIDHKHRLPDPAGAAERVRVLCWIFGDAAFRPDVVNRAGGFPLASR